MAGRKNGLGRGLDAFFPDRTSVVKEPARKTITKTVKTEKKSDVAEKQTNPTVAKKQTADSKTGAMIVKISSVEPNMDQPRKQFDEDALMELSESIKQYGVLHPLLVSDKKDYYEIIAGERRWRAAKLAGLTEIPVIVKEFSEQELVEISLIENIQREDLNPVEEAMAYKRLIDEFHLKQDEIAERVGKSRTAVTNAMRLLKLSEKVQQMLIDEMITAGHARAILSIADKEKQESIAMKVFDEKLSVRETEALVKRMLEPPKTAKKSKFSSAEDAIYESLEEKMKSIMGTRVQIHRKKNDKGKIEIEYYVKIQRYQDEMIELLGTDIWHRIERIPQIRSCKPSMLKIIAEKLKTDSNWPTNCDALQNNNTWEWRDALGLSSTYKCNFLGADNKQ